MPDVYATITEAEPAVVAGLVDILELRAADPQQREMREAYLSDVAFPPDARVVEVGCGPGPVARALAARPGVGEVVGVDPSPIFVEKGPGARRRPPNLTFVEGDARALPLEDGSFDVVVFHTCSATSRAGAALAEACRVLRPTAAARVFDGDYATTTCRVRRARPAAGLRRRPSRASSTTAGSCAGCRGSARGQGSTLDPPGRAQLHRGARIRRTCSRSSTAAPGCSAAAGTIGAATADALRAEARRRAAAGTYFAHISYASFLARATHRRTSGRDDRAAGGSSRRRGLLLRRQSTPPSDAPQTASEPPFRAARRFSGRKGALRRRNCSSAGPRRLLVEKTERGLRVAQCAADREDPEAEAREQ